MPKSPNSIVIPEAEVELTAMTAQGSGGQNVNKVASAIHLRFDIPSSSLPERVKTRLLQSGGQRITRTGVLILKSQRFRSQEQNRIDALQRLQEIVHDASRQRQKRRPTTPTRGSQLRRVEAKVKRGQNKALRRKVDY